jgi:Tol biopolymer transport system component
VSFNPDAKLSLGDALKGEARKLSISPGAFQSPHFSPNGKHLLLVQNTQERDLLILADANGAPVCSVASLTNGAFFAWSGDGKHIAWIDTVSPVFEAERVIVLDLATNKRIESQDKIIAFWWSPNGRYLATYSILESKDISTSAPVQLSINILDTQNAKTTHVANFLPTRDFGQQLGFFDQYSRASSPWSPDSTALVYSEVLTDRPAAEIIVAKLNTNASGEIQNISARPIAEGTFATWSPK